MHSYQLSQLHSTRSRRTETGKSGNKMAGCAHSREMSAEEVQRIHFPTSYDLDVWKKSIRETVPDLILQDDNGFGLFVGNFQHSIDVKGLQELGITWVLNVASEHVYENGFDPREMYGDAFTYLGIAMDDVPEYYITKHFGKTNDYIQRAYESGAKILVHCKAGRSRSVATVMAYLIASREMSMADAARLINEKRPFACPNAGFLKQLGSYEKERMKTRTKTEQSQSL